MLAIEPLALDIKTPLTHFAQRGFARLGVVLDAHGIDELRSRCDDLMMGVVRYPTMFFQHDSPTGRYDELSYGKGWVGPSRAYRKLEGLELDDTIRAWIENALFARRVNFDGCSQMNTPQDRRIRKAPIAMNEYPGQSWRIVELTEVAGLSLSRFANVFQKGPAMSAIQIPRDTITPHAFDGLVEEFVTRDGTDYGFAERTLDEKKSAVIALINRGDAVIVFDPDSETCNIVLEAQLTDL